MTIQTTAPRKRVKAQAINDEALPENTTPSLRYGPRFPHQRIWSRGIIICGVMIYIWYFSKVSKETILAAQKDTLQNRGQQFDCDSNYLADINRFHQCVPGFELGSTKGSASIFDILQGL